MIGVEVASRVLLLLCVSAQSRRSLCEEALLKVRGVISFTFQMGVKRCIVRVRSDLKAEVRQHSCVSYRTFSVTLCFKFYLFC